MIERDECEDCGGEADTIEMGRRWCKDCLEQFQNEYDEWYTTTLVGEMVNGI